MTCYASLQFCLLKLIISISHKLAPEESLHYKHCFSLFETHFDDRPKILIYRKNFPKIFFACKLSHKNIKVSQAQCNPYPQVTLKPATAGDGIRILSSLMIIIQNDTRNRNIEYLISCLQKISLEQRLFE